MIQEKADPTFMESPFFDFFLWGLMDHKEKSVCVCVCDCVRCLLIDLREITHTLFM